MIDQIFSQVSVAGVPSYLGPEYLAQNDAPPSIVWVPESGQFDYGKRVTRYTSDEPRSIATCKLKVRCRLWAAWPQNVAFPEGYNQSQSDYQSLWELLRQFLVALRTVAVGSYELGQLRLLTEEGDAMTELGKAADVDVTWDIPVTTDPVQTVLAAHLTQEGTLATSTPVTEAPGP